jgi:homopolymeric O-antigen transport system ATP-binding protein
MTEPAIRVEELAKCYRLGRTEGRLPRIIPAGKWARVQRRRPGKADREVWALRSVSFEVAPGEVLGIVGPNGAGKTTLLKLLARITPPTGGRAELRGRVVSLLELGAGFQRESTGRQNIVLNSLLHGIPHSEVDARMDEIVGFAGLGEAIDRPVGKYSSGMFLRLAFSLAVHMQPDILLADEVLAVGDIEFQELALRRVEVAGREGMAVLFVSHDMATIRRLCRRTMWMNQGEITAIGETEDVVTAYEEAADAHLAASPLEDRDSAWGKLERVRLLSADGSEIGAVSISEPTRLEFSFRTHKPDTGVRAGFSVLSNGKPVFTSVLPDELQAPEPGLHRATVHIPAHLLADHDYQVSASLILTRKGKTSVMIRDKVLAFRGYEGSKDNELRGTYTGPYYGVLRPLLEWEAQAGAEDG